MREAEREREGHGCENVVFDFSDIVVVFGAGLLVRGNVGVYLVR